MKQWSRHCRWAMVIVKRPTIRTPVPRIYGWFLFSSHHAGIFWNAEVVIHKSKTKYIRWTTWNSEMGIANGLKLQLSDQRFDFPLREWNLLRIIVYLPPWWDISTSHFTLGVLPSIMELFFFLYNFLIFIILIGTSLDSWQSARKIPKDKHSISKVYSIRIPYDCPEKNPALSPRSPDAIRDIRI